MPLNIGLAPNVVKTKLGGTVKRRKKKKKTKRKKKRKK